MIRLYLNLCKTFHKIKHLDDCQLYSFLVRRCFPDAPPCPSCTAPASAYSHNGSYQRYFLCYTNGSVCSHIVSVPSLLCRSCRKSHALLLSVLIPHSSYGMGFLISLLYARITGKFPSVPSLCAHFDISESTYYRIRKRFTLDSRLLLDALRSFLQTLELVDFLHSCDPVLLHSALAFFFQSAGFSFLQPCVRFRPKIPLTRIPPGYAQIT